MLLALNQFNTLESVCWVDGFLVPYYELPIWHFKMRGKAINICLAIVISNLTEPVLFGNVESNAKYSYNRKRNNPYAPSITTIQNMKVQDPKEVKIGKKYNVDNSILCTFLVKVSKTSFRI